ncbi:ankyrin repeat-containing domain protein [Ilyonectria robusta]|uniref:ankyrin repeat-containing domain protein n=1 Tax=Ilyonectria robusta TaxID=1079257 RepID=UPI001E8D7258|nr:ankyrin repeat-containing domain protein [Ilyonectria robusta]KAH8669302.1 ankyrin repeat-containing domain protein [Ilyonectria robusta]
MEVVKLLIEKGASVTVTDEDGWTPLHAASQNGHIEVVRLLLITLGVETSRADNHGRTALFFASRCGYNNVVQALLADGRIDPGSKDWYRSTSLFAAVRNGHFEVVELLLAAGGITIEGQDGFGRSLFWWARRTGNLRVLQLLVQHAERAGSPIPDDPAPVNAASIPFDHESAWCDACTLSIRKGCGYSCRVCDSGGFYLCVECFDGGIRCRDISHVLVPR